MLRSIKMQNFRRHADVTIEFTSGINAIRAPNEHGKSTMLEAVAYAYFGARALKEPLEDVVTYGMAPSKLKVEHTFELAGVEYQITRSKAGAELRAPGLVVTGQTEVTKFVEGLFGASQDMASKLMVAKQKALGGALTDGATAAGKMIEDLANLDLIEELTSLIAEHLPSGHTSSQEGVVAALQEQTTEVEIPDLAPLAKAISDADVSLQVTRSDAKQLSDQLLQLELPDCRKIVADFDRLQQLIVTSTATINKLDEHLAVILPAAPGDAEIARARASVEAQKKITDARRLHAELEAANIKELWDKDLDSLSAETAQAQGAVDAAAAEARSLQQKIADSLTASAELTATYRVAYAKLEGQLIRETSCAFCDKDLTDVPEVVLRNSHLSDELRKLEANYRAAADGLAAQVSELRGNKAGAEEAEAASQTYLNDLQAAVKRNNVAELLYARAGEFIEVSRAGVPGTWSWTGPDLLSGPQTDYQAKLRELEADRDAALSAAATRAALARQRHDLADDREVAQSQRDELEIDEARRQLAEETRLAPELEDAMQLVWGAERAHTAAVHQFELAKQRREQALADRAAAARGLAAAEETLAEMRSNNALVKKLKLARPAITDKLWASVLASVSTYFSDVRGERSIITRVDGKFRVNGRPVSGLSGSAEDALGLAIRFALTRTFLPNINFVILDEVAAACDDQREMAMLGLLATSGFNQVILVTHSSHSDAFAQNIITL